MAVAAQVLCLYRGKYFDFSVRHFHEKLREQHAVLYGYTAIKRLLQGAGLVAKTRPRGAHRRRRERRPIAGILLHIDASQHRWLGGEQWHDLIVVLDDATARFTTRNWSSRNRRPRCSPRCAMWCKNMAFSALYTAIARRISGALPK